MSNTTAISWTTFTLNLWWGCAKVSPACDHCYAETFAARYRTALVRPKDGSLGIWDPKGPRLAKRDWKAELRGLERERVKLGMDKATVFVQSMSDIFERSRPLVDTNGNPTGRTTGDERAEFFGMVEEFPDLIFLLLTKRIGNVYSMVPDEWNDLPYTTDFDWWPENCWLGITACNQTELNRDLPKLLSFPAHKFLSIEPMLGPINLHEAGAIYPVWDEPASEPHGESSDLRWVICGGESGHHARPMNPEWVRSLRNQCEEAGVPFHFKQWGEYCPAESDDLASGWEGQNGESSQYTAEHCFTDYNHEVERFFRTSHRWPTNFPDDPNDQIHTTSVRVGTKKAGRTLDGRTHDWTPLSEGGDG